MFLPRNHHLQMSSCLSGGGRAYAFELEIIKSPSPTSTVTATTRASNASSSSSPSSTLSESSNSGLAITTRKPRTPRKRPNQTYNEAAALLSTAYPNLFPAANPNTTSSSKLAKSTSDASSSSLSDDSAELFFPFRGVVDDEYSSGFLLLPERLSTRFRPKLQCASPGEIDSGPNCYSGAMELSCKYDDGEDFDADSILDEEVDEGGIDSIMGNLSVKSEPAAASDGATTCYGYPMGLGLGFGVGRISGVGVRALRRADEGNWWSFPAVDMVELSPRLRKPAEKGNGAKKKKMKKVERERAEVVAAVVVEPPRVAVAEEKEAGLLLKLNYDGVLNAWSDKGSPFSDEAPGQDVQRNDVAVGVSNSARKPKCRKQREKKEKK